ncbi:M56 family metallopeptidase [uncultured Polaribacter sp.]|uniref:M56 family metallopeptidase n=1 Tax=uncultured Polaribacter sp. TaxID=174711 RepID=UPI0026128DB0|nr:M56 family metallopeptidase [uncultured Polaribacter sp.]
MITYVLKSASCLALLLFFYHFVLEKEKMHAFNRFYLLIGVLLSFLVPFATITVAAIPEVITVTQTFEQPVFTEGTTAIIVEETRDYTIYFISFYLLISSILFLRFGRNLFKIIRKIRLNEKIAHQNATLVLVDDKILPHTFWKAIFINKTDYKKGLIEEELFTHELTHVTQKHTIDVLLIELLQIIFWINPLFIFLKKAVQLNHEFLADENVIIQHKNTFHYQHLLLNKAAWNNAYYLASNLNYSLTKKRLKMMTTQRSKTNIWLKKLAVIPLLTGVVFLFAERVEAQEKQEKIETIYEQPNNQEKLTDSEMYKEYINKTVFITFTDKKGKKTSKRYAEMSREEKELLNLPPPPPLEFKKNVPSKKQLEDFKNREKHAIWIDGKVVKNEVLEKYKNTDFARYFNSFVNNNARSKRFPQKNQINLETFTYFENQNKKRVNDYLEYLKKENIIEIVEDAPKKKDYIDSPIPTQKSSRQSVPIRTTSIKSKRKKGTKTIEDIRLKLKDVNALKISYVENDSVPSFIKEARKESNEKYNKLNKLYESNRVQKPHFVKSSQERQKELQESFSLLGSLYFKLSKEDKRKSKRPIHPHYPYLKLTKNNKIFYKLRSELTEEDRLLIPPPPKPPKNHLDQVIEMAKKGATFYHEKQPINSDKAIDLLKKNKKLSIHSKSTNNGNYEVWISKTPLDDLNRTDLEVIDVKKLEKYKKDDNITYYLNGKKISESDLTYIATSSIKGITIDKKMRKIYIVSKTPRYKGESVEKYLQN